LLVRKLLTVSVREYYSARSTLIYYRAVKYSVQFPFQCVSHEENQIEIENSKVFSKGFIKRPYLMTCLNCFSRGLNMERTDTISRKTCCRIHLLIFMQIHTC